MSDAITKETTLTVGLDLGDRYIQVCVLDETGEVVEESRLSNRRAALERRFGVCEPLRIVLEAGTHSPWVSRLLVDLGHEVLVANPRKLRLIYKNESKSDRVDAEYLAQMCIRDSTNTTHAHRSLPLRHSTHSRNIRRLSVTQTCGPHVKTYGTGLHSPLGMLSATGTATTRPWHITPPTIPAPSSCGVGYTTSLDTML